jgi:hypothetical protein
MPGITLAQAQAKLTEYMDAESAILTGQSYSIAGRSLTRADLKAVQDGIERYQKMVNRLSRGGIKIRGGTPV